MFLEQLIYLNKNDNIDCKWVCKKKVRGTEYDFDGIIQQMIQLNIVSSIDVQHYTMQDLEYKKKDIKFGCYSLFDQKICFEQDYQYVNIITRSKWSRDRIESKLN